MTGNEFARKIRKVGKDRGVRVSFDTEQGKGSHGTLYYGSCKTTLKDRTKEIGPGLLNKMLRDLGLTSKDI